MITLIPAIDLIDGQCVRLHQGNYTSSIVYSTNPLEVAKDFEQKGFKRLHIVDLDGAKKRAPQNLAVLESIASQTNLQIDFGGGVQSAENVQQCLNAGAQLIAIGSLAVKNKASFLSIVNEFNPALFFLGADVRNQLLAIHGWLETSTLSITDFIQDFVQLGFVDFFCTDISKDGMLQGPSIELYKALVCQFPTINLTASGGVASIGDIEQLDTLGCHGVILGKALYEHKIAYQALQKYL